MAQLDDDDNELGPEIDIQDFDRPDFKFEPNEVHEWKQEGPYIICKGCELVHAHYIGMEKLMVGINDKGQPILKRR